MVFMLPSDDIAASVVFYLDCAYFKATHLLQNPQSPIKLSRAFETSLEFVSNAGALPVTVTLDVVNLRDLEKRVHEPMQHFLRFTPSCSLTYPNMPVAKDSVETLHPLSRFLQANYISHYAVVRDMSGATRFSFGQNPNWNLRLYRGANSTSAGRLDGL
ncbi:MAG TPA: hypothetical protein VK158_00935 [Acidobacteriota bacterium]|nr:hypothetical protein [Acidobacteriota bacterium]